MGILEKFFEKKSNGDILVGEGLDAECISDAVEQAPDHTHDHAPDDGTKIYVTSKYNPDKEKFPIRTGGKQITIEGCDRAAAYIFAPSDKPAFVLECVGSADYGNKCTLKNLHISGGNPAIRVVGGKGNLIENVIFGGPDGPAIQYVKYQKTGETCTTNRVRGCHVLWGQDDAFVIGRGAAGHSTHFENCEVTRTKGTGFVLRGANVTVKNGEAQFCEKYGIRVYSAASTTIQDMYFEKNGAKLSYPIDIDITNGVGVNVHNCYSNAMGKCKRMVNIRDGYNHDIQNLTAVGFGSKGTDGELIGVHSGVEKPDLHLHSHWGKGDATIAIVDEDSARSDGHKIGTGTFGGTHKFPKYPDESDGGSSGEDNSTPSTSEYKILKGTEFETTVHVYDSGKEGPTTLVTGGIHGDELGGIEAAKSLTRASIPKGKLVVVCPANAYATAQGYRNCTLRKDGNFGDLNRKFPIGGEPQGSIAKALWGEFEKHQPDWYFDLHTASGYFDPDGKSRDLPKEQEGSVGQCLFPTAAGSSRMYASEAASWTNEKYNIPHDRRFLLDDDDIDGTNPLLMHYYYDQMKGEGILCEAAELHCNVEEQKDHLLCVVSTAMKHYGQQPQWPDQQN